MKSQILKLTSAAGALALMAGCIVLSVYPFYTEKDLMFDPGLAGKWSEPGKTNAYWQFEAQATKAFLLTAVDDHDTNSFEAHLFQLKHYQFLDLLSVRREDFQMPVHLIAKWARTNDAFSMQFMDYAWLASLLETNPAVLRHIVVPTEAGNTNNNMPYLTAETKELQKFLLKHADDTNAFNTTVDLKRVQP